MFDVNPSFYRIYNTVAKFWRFFFGFAEYDYIIQIYSRYLVVMTKNFIHQLLENGALQRPNGICSNCPSGIIKAVKCLPFTATQI